MRSPIVFVTDYGRDDAYAAALTGAAWRIDPRLVCVEGTHGVPPGDVLAGAYHLKSLVIAFERQAVLCAVVDPGVGTERRAIAVDCAGVRCVAPDNGLVSYLWREAPPSLRSIVQLDVPVDASTTFHGRDLFAPAAAQLASGSSLADCGGPSGDPLILESAFSQATDAGLQGVVAVVDHFGNSVTTVRDVDLANREIAEVRWSGGGTDRVVAAYEQIDDGVAALIGSAGHLEISARGRPAAAAGGPPLHDTVVVELR